MSEYASKGVAGAGLGLGIAGAALGVMNGGLGNILGGAGWNANGWNNCNGDNMPINRYEAAQSARIAELETEVKLRDANTYTMTEMGKLRDYVDHKFGHMEREICDQKVYNATNTAVIGCIQGQVNELLALTVRKVPNTSVCPGWGDVTVSVTPATTGA